MTTAIFSDQTETAKLGDDEPSPFSGGWEPEPEVSQRQSAAEEHPWRVCDVPMPMAEVITGSGLIMQGVEDFAGHEHPFDGKCKVCDKPLTEGLWRQIDAKLAPGWFPVNCCEHCYEEAQKDHATEQANRELWERLCPPDFRDNFDPKKGNQKLLDRVLKFQPSQNRGMLIHGPSDTGKTRVVWQLLRSLAPTGISWLFIESIDLLDSIPTEAFTTQLLVIDDLGNDALKGPKEVKLLKLLRTRCNWHRPFIITTQYNGDLLAEKFSDSGTAQAVIRRMRQFCDPVHARAPGEGGITRDAQGRAVMQ